MPPDTATTAEYDYMLAAYRGWVQRLLSFVDVAVCLMSAVVQGSLAQCLEVLPDCAADPNSGSSQE
jgi:hypothetical protein